MTRPATTAASVGLLVCHACALLSRPQHPRSRCPRCGAHLYLRKHHSVARTWLLLFAAAILYIPANMLPMMHTSSLFGSQSDTILSGAIYFWDTGSWYLAVIIFVTSIMVPLLKMFALGGLLFSVQQRSRRQPERRAMLYRLLGLIGRWSMLDIYVVAIVVTLVQAGVLGSAEPGIGAVAFGAVVVLTMFASMSFDPRLIWDTAEPTDG